IHVLTDNTPAAIEVMERLFKGLDDSSAGNARDLRFHPGLVSILVALYRNQGRRSHVKQELAKAASYWQQKPTAPPSLLRAAGSALLESSDPKDLKAAAGIFSKLREQQQRYRW
ncbi:MAG: Signal recognition particle core component, partial [Watsoniomyces obsoletus]